MRSWGALILVGCGRLTAAEAEQRLQDALIDVVEKKDDVYDAVLRVEAPTLGVDGVWTAGVADERDGALLTADRPFLSASVGKLFTATAVMALADRGEIDLDAPFTTWVDAAEVAGLPVVGGDKALATVTVRELLSHQSGLPDPFDPKESKPKDDAASILEWMSEDPDRTWTRDQVLDYTRDHYEAAGAPGEGFQYSDVNYELLGLVLEAVAGAPYDQVVTEEVIAPLGLSSTWYYNLSEPPTGVDPHADVWIEDQNVARSGCLTSDGAGGGLATTTADLHLLMRSLNDGLPVSLDEFGTDWQRGAIAGGIDYGYGTWQLRPGGIFFLLGGYPDMIGVSGVTGSYLYYVPEWDAVISGTFNQTEYREKHIKFLLSKVLPTLNRVK